MTSMDMNTLIPFIEHLFQTISLDLKCEQMSNYEVSISYNPFFTTTPHIYTFNGGSVATQAEDLNIIEQMEMVFLK